MAEDDAPEGGSVPEADPLEKLFRFGLTHRVRHDEIDAQGVVGQARWLDLFTLARTEYLRNLNITLEGGRAPVQAVVRWTELEYLAPARFDDKLLLRARVSQLGERSLTFELLADDAEHGLRLVVASAVLVCIEVERFRSTPWPAAWRGAFSAFEGARLELAGAPDADPGADDRESD